MSEFYSEYEKNLTQRERDDLLCTSCQYYDKRDPDYLSSIRRNLENGANPNSCYLMGGSVVNGAMEVVKHSVLYGAALFGNMEVVKILIKFGADVNYDDALMSACRSRKWRIVKILLDAGADPNQHSWPGGHPLMYVVCDNSVKILKLLLAHNANVDIDNGLALKLAAFGGDNERVALLLKSGAKVDIEAQFDSIIDERALYLAASKGRTKCAQLLLEAGANANARSRDHKTALHVAALSGFYDIVHLLLKAGANMYNVDKQGKTPLIYAREQSYNLNLLPRPLLECRRAYRCLGTHMVIDATLALASMNVSPYVMLWILQWAYNLRDGDQLWVLRVIEGVQKSRARIVATKI